LTVDLSRVNNGILNLEEKVNTCVDLLRNLDSAYQQKDAAFKQHIVSSIFPSKLIFDTKKVRTLEVNSVVTMICSIDKGSRGYKKRQHTDFGVLSLEVERKRFELSVQLPAHTLSKRAPSATRTPL
jgi:hypothetical protein